MLVITRRRACRGLIGLTPALLVVAAKEHERPGDDAAGREIWGGSAPANVHGRMAYASFTSARAAARGAAPAPRKEREPTSSIEHGARARTISGAPSSFQDS